MYGMKDEEYIPVGRKDLSFCYPSDLVLYPHAHLEVNSSSSVYHESHEMIKASISTLGFDISISTKNYGIDLGYESESGHIHYHMDDLLRVAAIGTYYTSTFKMVNPPYIVATLNPYLVTVLSKIPTYPKTDEDLLLVKILIDKWGHFFLEEGIFGGGIHYANFMERRII